MSFEAVVFDMDGVLVDSEVLWRDVRIEFAAGLGKRWRAEDQASIMGSSTAVWSQLMVDRLQLDMSAAEVAHEIKGRLLAKYEAHLPLRDGAVEAVKRAATRYKVALASGSPSELIAWITARTGLDRIFEATMNGDDVANGKPDPAIYLEVLKKLGVAPQRAIGVEDSANGIRALRAAGMAVIAAPGPEFPLSAEVLGQADAVIDSMDEISLAMIDAIAARRSLGG